MTVVQPFLSTLNFLGGILENIIEHPDIVFEILAGILSIAGGAAAVVGGGGLELVTGGTASPVAIPIVAGGVGVAVGGAGMVGHGIDRWMNEATTTPDRRPGVDRGDGRDYLGHWTSRDPDAPPRDHALAEEKGLQDAEKEYDVKIIRDKVNVQYDGSPQPGGRYYDGFFPNGDGTYTAVEVKSGNAWDRYKNPETSTQREFDDGVSPQNPAIGIYNGQEIRITRVIPQQVK